MTPEPERAPVILNVDDYEAGRYVITRILESARFRVREAASGRETLRLVAAERPDLVLLDVNLPDMSGLEVCRRIKSDPTTARIPVVHISASSTDDSDKVRGLAGGADSYLTEPVDAGVLVATVNAMLRLRRAEDTARLAARQWQTTFDAIRDGVALLDSEGRILRWNRTLERMLGVKGEEEAGRLCSRLWHKEDEPPEDFAFVRARESHRREEMDLQHDGRWFHIRVDPVIEGGRMEGGVYLVSDITDRKRLEEQFRQAQKFESIGRLAGGVAHDFNNLLTSILGNTSMVAGDLPPGPQRERLEDVLQAGERAAHLTQQLLAYSGQGRFVLKKTDLSALVADLDDLLRSSLSRKVALVLDLHAGLPMIEADPRQIQQVVLNLVANAGEAIGEKSGTVTVTTRTAPAEAGLEGAGPFAILEVHDTGPGMSDSVKSHLFEPFYTTRFMGRGLGLAAVSGIVRGHKGHIHVESEPGKGACFRIFFPAMAPASQWERRKRPQVRAGEKPLVLVVDDEEVVRRVAQAALEARGYWVVLANDGRQAVEVVRRQGAQLALILLDMTMPVLSGEEAMEEISKLTPHTPVIASSGYGEQEAERRFGKGRVSAFLRKPYTARQLAEKVETAIRGAGEQDAPTAS